MKMLLKEYIRIIYENLSKYEITNEEFEKLKEDILLQSISISGYNKRVRLSTLRKKLKYIYSWNIEVVNKENVDLALLNLLKNREIILYPLDDPRERTPEDVKDGIVIGGEIKSVLYVPSEDRK